MNFRQFLSEEKTTLAQRRKQERKYSKEIKKARLDLAKKHKVDPDDLEFAFAWELDMGYGTRLCFNIIDTNHDKYGSTVAQTI